MEELRPIKLPAEEIKRLEELAKVEEFLDAEIRRMERAGIDVREMRKTFEETRRLRAGLLREYR